MEGQGDEAGETAKGAEDGDAALAEVVVWAVS